MCSTKPPYLLEHSELYGESVLGSLAVYSEYEYVGLKGAAHRIHVISAYQLAELTGFTRRAPATVSRNESSGKSSISGDSFRLKVSETTGNEPSPSRLMKFVHDCSGADLSCKHPRC